MYQKTVYGGTDSIKCNGKKDEQNVVRKHKNNVRNNKLR